MVTWVRRAAPRLYAVCNRHSSPTPPGWLKVVASTNKMRLSLPFSDEAEVEAEVEAEQASSSPSNHNSHRLAQRNRLRQAASEMSANPTSTAHAPNWRNEETH